MRKIHDVVGDNQTTLLDSVMSSMQNCNCSIDEMFISSGMLAFIEDFR